MKIAFVGDIHGRVFHALAALVKWQKVNEIKLDLIVQAGDLGAYPYPDEKLLNNRFVIKDSTELDFSKLISGGRQVDEFADIIKTELTSPVYFIRGNHEDFKWLDSLKDEGGICAADDYGLFKYVQDGTVKSFDMIKFAFLGGAEFGAKNGGEINQEALERLMLETRDIDILVTHETYFGVGFSYHGITQGSRNITELVDKLKPDFHITAHYHHMIGPHDRHGTIHMGLNNLVLPLRGKPGRNLRAGCIALMDTENRNVEFVKDEWLTNINTYMSLDDLEREMYI
ncbi:MAG: metallophosphoesterase [Clostridia bacterium]|nr:metallophosphoesterase [Clostridia bacterium]MBN2883341.1 metallophosphoesterase [Clostridia bacterium]